MLKSEIQNLQNEISKSSMKVDDRLSPDLIKIMSQCGQIRRVPFHEVFLGGITKYLEVSCKKKSVTIQ